MICTLCGSAWCVFVGIPFPAPLFPMGPVRALSHEHKHPTPSHAARLPPFSLLLLPLLSVLSLHSPPRYLDQTGLFVKTARGPDPDPGDVGPLEPGRGQGRLAAGQERAHHRLGLQALGGRVQRE